MILVEDARAVGDKRRPPQEYKDPPSDVCGVRTFATLEELCGFKHDGHHSFTVEELVEIAQGRVDAEEHSVALSKAMSKEWMSRGRWSPPCDEPASSHASTAPIASAVPEPKSQAMLMEIDQLSGNEAVDLYLESTPKEVGGENEGASVTLTELVSTIASTASAEEIAHLRRKLADANDRAEKEKARAEKAEKELHESKEGVRKWTEGRPRVATDQDGDGSACGSADRGDGMAVAESSAAPADGVGAATELPAQPHMLRRLSAADEVAFDDGAHVGKDADLTLTLVRAGSHPLNCDSKGGGLIKFYASLYGTEHHEFREPALTGDLARQSYFTIVAFGPKRGIRGAATVRMLLFGGELVSEVVMLLVIKKQQRLGSRLVEAVKTLHRQECESLALKGVILALPLDSPERIAEKTFGGARGFRPGAERQRDALYGALRRTDGLSSFSRRGIDVKDESAVAAAYAEWEGSFEGLDLKEQKRRYAEGFRWNTQFPNTAYSWREQPSSNDEGGGDEGWDDSESDGGGDGETEMMASSKQMASALKALKDASKQASAAQNRSRTAAAKESKQRVEEAKAREAEAKQALEKAEQRVEAAKERDFQLRGDPERWRLLNERGYIEVPYDEHRIDFETSDITDWKGIFNGDDNGRRLQGHKNAPSGSVTPGIHALEDGVRAFMQSRGWLRTASGEGKRTHLEPKEAYAIRDEPGCGKQPRHADSAPRNSYQDQPWGDVPKVAWYATADDSHLHVYPFGQEDEVTLTVKKGTLVIFRGDLGHAGAAHSGLNKDRGHVYIDSPVLRRKKENGETLTFHF